MTKCLILDSGTLINLSMNGLLYIISELKKATEVRFAITEAVKYETVDRPIGVPRFELGAIRIKDMIESRDLEMPNAFEVSQGEIKQKTDELMDLANKAVVARGKHVKIVSEAEISCLALSSILTDKGVKNMIGVDERTTRILAEKPQNLQKLMSKKVHFNVSLQEDKLRAFQEYKFMRSTELVYVAFKKGVLRINDPKALEAVLYATKYKGASVSFDEIDALKKL